MKAVKNLIGLLGLSAVLLAMCGVGSVFGASVTVLVGSNGSLTFSPATNSIPVNSSVIWSWAGNFHSTTSGSPPGTNDGLWDSGVNIAPHFFTNTFTLVGNYPYFCSVHYAAGMVGDIIVTNTAVPPVVTITNPASGVVLSAPASLTLAASATVASGSITNVQFFQGSTLLASVTAPPFSVQVGNLAAATYTFSAVAAADGGLTATNSISVNVINARSLAISSPAVSTAGHFGFDYTSDAGLTYVVQVSTSLASGWTSIATNTALTSPTVFVDPNAGSAISFYRVLRLPNP